MPFVMRSGARASAAGFRVVVAAVAAAILPTAALAGGDLDTVAASLPTDRIIVKLRDGRAESPALAALQAAANQRGTQFSLQRRGALGALVLRLDRRLEPAAAEALARALSASPEVSYAEPDWLMQPMLMPNDSRYGDQWHYFEATAGLNLPAAWDKATGSGVRVAVIDTGVRPHADLAANLLPGYDFIGDTAVSNDGDGRDSDASDPGDAVSAGECGTGQPAQSSSWHGTHVAGTIAAVTNNGSGVAGVAFGAKVLPVRVLGKCGGYTSDIADAIVWSAGGSVAGVPANANPARVLNLSLGGGGSCGTTTQNAINSARANGAVVVVAAGNSNANASAYTPASCSGVIAVAAVNRSGGRSYYSNYGSVVDVAAPGGDMRSNAADGILSTLNSGSSAPGADSLAYYQGTSMATPHVAGAAALMLSVNGALTPDEVETRLKASTRAFPATCSQCGTGIVDADAAVVAATGGGGGDPGPTDPTPVAEVENNNTRNRAQVITPNPALVNGTLSSTSDTDYFRVSLAAGATLTSTLTPPAGKDYDLYLYNSNGSQIASSTNGSGQVDSVAVVNNGGSAATVYVRVRYYSGGSGSYTLLLSQ
jgi:serine protease